MVSTFSPLLQSRHISHPIPGPRSRQLQEQRNGEVSSAFGAALPVFIDRAEGGILQDVDGNRIIDFASGIAVTSVGATNAFVQAKVAAQLDRFTHTCFMVTEYEGFTEVCRWLNAHTPGTFDKRTALFSTGAEAVENAIKIARSATGRPNVLVFDEGYHGRSLLTMAMTAKENPYKLGFGPFPEQIFRAPNAAPLRWPGGPENAASEALAAVEAILAENGPESFAAMVIEPIQGEGGFLVPAEGFLAGLRKIADAHGIVFVIDEIQAGMGRTGTLFASEYDGVEADLIVTAKALGGGLPLSAVTGRTRLMNAVRPGGLGGTYAGNPLACAAAHAVLDIFDEDDLLGRAVRLGERLKAGLNALAARFPDHIGEVRGLGAMLAFELVEDPHTRVPATALAQRVVEAARERGLLLLKAGMYASVIRILVPLTAEDRDLDEGLTILGEALEAAIAGG